MVAIYDIKNPPKRKVVKNRVSRQHHWVMIFPTDLSPRAGLILKGMPYASFFDSFLSDCVDRMYKSNWANRLHEEGESKIMTACLN
jgi:hypothetical protein